MPAPERAKTTLRISCNDVVPGCGFTASGGTEEELIDKVAAHAAHDHGVREMTGLSPPFEVPRRCAV